MAAEIVARWHQRCEKQVIVICNEDPDFSKMIGAEIAKIEGIEGSMLPDNLTFV